MTTAVADGLVDTKNDNKKSLRIGNKVDAYDLKKMPPILRSKFYIYIEPSSKISAAQMASHKRVQHANKQQKLNKGENQMYTSFPNIASSRLLNTQNDNILQNEKLRHERLIGQLKAAEARNRIRMMRLRYVNNRTDDIDHLIQCQPTAVKAVRLEAFLPNEKSEKINQMDNLTPIERRRLEALINDNMGILVDRNT